MRFLITGGAGFLGSALVNYLAEAGHHVRVLDDLSAGDRALLRPDVTFERGDVRDVPKLWSLLHRIDCVYHLAAKISVPESIHYPIEYSEVNVGGTVCLMTAVRDARVKRVVLASSGALYGEQEAQPIKEDARPKPASPYAVSKVAAEHYVRCIGELYSIEVVVLRIFNAYGPHQRVPVSYAPVIPRFIKNAVADGTLVVHGTGEQTRDFVYVDDVVQGMVAAGSTPEAKGHTINVGSGQEVSVNDLLRKIERIVGRRLNVVRNTVDDGGVSRAVADLALARSILGYVPRTDIDDGLSLMIEHYRERQRSLQKGGLKKI